MTILEIQTALKAAGFDPGPLDGVFGRATRKAVEALQAKAAVTVNGIVGLDTVHALNVAVQLAHGLGTKPVLKGAIEPPWSVELGRRMGLHEDRDRSVLSKWLRSDGRTVGDPSKHPWCGDAIETPIALTLPDEPLPTNPYLARNWLTFGVPLRQGALGAIMVFWRGSRIGSQGHVAQYVRETADAYCVRGGNQRDGICEVPISKERLLGIRWPKTYPLPTTGPVLATSRAALSTNEA